MGAYFFLPRVSTARFLGRVSGVATSTDLSSGGRWWLTSEVPQRFQDSARIGPDLLLSLFSAATSSVPREIRSPHRGRPCKP